MEGKELYNDDEELNPKSNKKEEEESDESFGLPEIEGENEEENPEDLGDPFSEGWEEKKEEEEESFSYSDDFNSDENSDSNYDYSEEQDEGDTDAAGEYQSSYYEEEYGQKKSPVGWIILGIFILIALVVAVFWWINREPEPEPIQQPVVQQPVVKEPEPEPEPVEPEPEPEPQQQAGVFEINQPTGRYHVIVASSIDKDLVRDYGEKLAGRGMTCNILAPRGNRKFHRLSVADFASLNDAAVRSEQLKGDFGDDVWVIRY